MRKVLRYFDHRGDLGGVLVANIDAIWAVREGDCYDGEPYSEGTRACIHTKESCLESSESAESLIEMWERLVGCG